MSKQDRLSAILELVKSNRVTSHEVLRELLLGQGIDVTQATVSRDIRELRLVKVQGAQGVSHYRMPEDWENKPPLRTLLPLLFLSAEGVGNMLVVRTMNGGGSAVAIAIDWEEWPEVVGTIAGDDTIFIMVRNEAAMPVVRDRLIEIAGGDPD